MRIQTIKRYLEHYPASFIAGKAIHNSFKLLKNALRFEKPVVINESQVSFNNSLHFAFPSIPANERRKVVKKADAIVKGKVFVFSNEYSGKVDWHKDYVNDKTYEKNGCDIRILWELNRGHVFLWLAEAYSLTKNKKYTIKFKELFLDWVNVNTYGSKPNWISPMEAGIRVVNLCHVFKIFYKEIKDESFWNEFFSQVFNHGVFIYNNLEWTPKIRGNHYLCNLIGLLYLGVLFEKTKEGKEWLTFAHKEIQKEMQYQVLSDGVDFEKSTWYHGFVTEIFLTAFLLFKSKKLKVEKPFEAKLKKMLFFLSLFTQKNSELLQVGDSDSGRLQRFYPVNGFEDVLYFGRKLLKKAEPGLHVFEKSGFVIYKNSEICFTFFSGATGTLGTGGHAHNSALSFTLNVCGKPIFIDPGTYIYTGSPVMRNLFRSTAYHNTVKVDNKEQNYFDSKHLFKLFDKTKAEIAFAGTVKGKIVIVGRHYGYEDQGIVHERLITIDPKEKLISIRDWFQGSGFHELLWNFHVGANKVKKINQGVEIENVKLFAPLPCALRNTWYSMEFGKKQSGNAISMHLQRVLMPKQFQFIIKY